uniref:Urease accessory protein UreH-like transmembrane domain-containing protein n=1 Tax=Eiseniibacteriota bacterium TaxID=2212470 RepID=A0A832MK78_UNCEI
MLDVNTFSISLLAAAAGLAVTHAVLGPDHYLPFLMLAKARRWSRARTLLVTAACGVGHVASSLALGAVGLAIGAGVGWVEKWEGARGDWAAWAMVWFGFAYLLWGLRRALRRRGGVELHEHGGHVHVHLGGGHAHHHVDASKGSASTFWALFVVFVLGPCEPLIPLFVLPASRGEWGLAALVGGVFGAVTILSMLALVLVGHAGLERLPLGRLERWAHAMAGAVVMASGLAVIYLGL